MRTPALVLAVLALSACTSAWERNYQPAPEAPPAAASAQDPAGAPLVLPSAGDPEADLRRAFALGFAPIGRSEFTGRRAGRDGLVSLAQELGADAVIAGSRSLGQRTEYRPVPVSWPVYTSLGFGWGWGGSGWRGSSIGFATGVGYAPVTTETWAQSAIFLRRMPPPCLGVLVGPPSDARRRAAGTNYGAEVLAVRDGSPAFVHGVLPGDVILSVDGAPVTPEAVERRALGPAPELTLLRGEERVRRTVPVDPAACRGGA